MKTIANNIFFILNMSNLFLFPPWKGHSLKKSRKNQSKERHYSGTLALRLGTEAWGNKTKKIVLRHSNEQYTSFVLFPQALEPSVNCNTSELVYLGIHAYQRNLGSHVTVRTSAPPVRKTTPKFDWQLYERNRERSCKTNLKPLHMKGCQSPNLKKPDKQGVQQSFRSPAMQKRPRSMTTTRQPLVAPSSHATSSSNSSRVAVTQTSAYSFTYQSSYLPSPMPAWSAHQTTHFSASTPAFSTSKTTLGHGRWIKSVLH